MIAGYIRLLVGGYKRKDTPWDAVLMGSVACTVNTKVQIFVQITNILTLFLNFDRAGIFITGLIVCPHRGAGQLFYLLVDSSIRRKV